MESSAFVGRAGEARKIDLSTEGTGKRRSPLCPPVPSVVKDFPVSETATTPAYFPLARALFTFVSKSCDIACSGPGILAASVSTSRASVSLFSLP